MVSKSVCRAERRLVSSLLLLLFLCLSRHFRHSPPEVTRLDGKMMLISRGSSPITVRVSLCSTLREGGGPIFKRGESVGCRITTRNSKSDSEAHSFKKVRLNIHFKSSCYPPIKKVKAHSFQFSSYVSIFLSKFDLILRKLTPNEKAFFVCWMSFSFELNFH